MKIDLILKRLEKGSSEIEKPDPEKLCEAQIYFNKVFEKYHFRPDIPDFCSKMNEYFSYLDLHSVRRGLFLIGPPGTGKTMILTILAGVFKFPFFTADELLSQVSKDWSFEEYFREEILGNDVNSYYYDYMVIDELGDEPTYSEFGMKYELMSRVINHRYKKFLEAGTKTFFSSNLSKNELTERYGHRIWSRLNQMCNIIHVKGEDQRLK